MKIRIIQKIHSVVTVADCEGLKWGSLLGNGKRGIKSVSSSQCWLFAKKPHSCTYPPCSPHGRRHENQGHEDLLFWEKTTQRGYDVCWAKWLHSRVTHRKNWEATFTLNFQSVAYIEGSFWGWFSEDSLRTRGGSQEISKNGNFWLVGLTCRYINRYIAQETSDT